MKAILFLLLAFTGTRAAPAAERWGVFEIELAGPALVLDARLGRAFVR